MGGVFTLCAFGAFDGDLSEQGRKSESSKIGMRRDEAERLRREATTGLGMRTRSGIVIELTRV